MTTPCWWAGASSSGCSTRSRSRTARRDLPWCWSRQRTARPSGRNELPPAPTCTSSAPTRTPAGRSSRRRAADDGQTRLTALDENGDEVWSRTPARETTFDATLLSGRILVRAGNRWSAYDTEDGRRLWTRLLPERPQFLPYGFELDSVPLLDADHALIGGTTALHTLDLRNGTMTSARLPTDGINTTYWPYEVVVSPGLIGVATNTGAVVVRRE